MSHQPGRSTVLSISAHDCVSSEGASQAPESPMPPRLVGLLNFVLVLVILGSVLVGVLFGLAHARDRYWVNIASGSWIALAWAANHDEWYPPLRDEAGNFAGTRYMPLFVLLHASAAKLTGEYLLSGRIVGYASAVGWFAAIGLLARQRGATMPIAGALAASVILSPVGIQGLCTIRSDGLALALQLWALWLIGRDDQRTTRMNVTLAAVLCATAFLCKLTALWAPAAIGLWLMWRQRAALLMFLGVFTGIIAAAALAIQTLSDGRFTENLLAASASGWQGWGAVLMWSPTRLLQFVSEWSPATWALMPAALLAVVLATASRDLGPVHLAWICCCGGLLVMFADVGVGENHVLEMAAITAALVGDLCGRCRAQSLAHLLLATTIIWCTLATVVQRILPDMNLAMRSLRTGTPSDERNPQTLLDAFTGRSVLSDDPTVAVLLGRKPVVADAFIFRAHAEAHPEWTAELIARIARREFEVIALTAVADPESWWYRELFLGADVVRAINEHYEFAGPVGHLQTYLPRSGTQVPGANQSSDSTSSSG